ncbi:sugar ABC transporter ATP-binding protein [Brucella anthropi]|uniref:ABC transporter related n=1 Tax=Brucella anthropi (strain ATCC 49188 / DSM 6882 / CCUG 24695 / JCM 21032 / LMG 3331 / NBRC 15819 / NCTC 12168 / Alc 37) TaxID=439375 RepID=A6X8E7_BRUA4|nr:sugar ABC transporter ATP-binding protein [Brucella anthropi]ABS17501.1 ABC transporter related [Brucella anthropi ATCC 49188]AIK42128.1 ABC transporter family protein [Brucella anthropi]KAB2727877.1 sugar ABC transporter ATP-binding protein [Brucella anthropi]KAB2746356.1 sugar ABC transporter ATP-binding protein [Brucella anthropi]KAB2775203.1 sugar ABC transporter ATP-binding protein [Brucella anthropi]
MSEQPVFRIEGVRKSFGPVTVLQGVDLDLKAGAVTVLMGANGAGKSTLVRILSGVYTRGAGTITLADAAFDPATPAEAIRAGVVTVHQNINDGVVADLDVATNLTLDRLNGRGARLFFNPRRVRREAAAVASRMGLAIDLSAKITDLTLADRQMVAIARAMAHEPKVLILDEPTSSLSSAEADRLFDLVDRLKARGVAILYISHRMSDIRRLADSIVSLRDGRITGRFEGPELDYEGAVNAMLGRKVSAGAVAVRDASRPVFSVRGLKLSEQARPFDFDLGDGEIVAVTGLVGVGKTALAETLFGARTPEAGEMTLDGVNYAPKTTGQAIARGVFLVAKDRAISGIVPDFNIYENISLPFLRRLSTFGISSRRAEKATARQQISSLGVVCRNERDEMQTLSGGNQQKVMVGRWLSEPSRLLILDEPFQGVDIAARRDIGEKLRASAAGRTTILFLTELDEAFEVADRILVMSEHTIVGEHRNVDINVERLLSEIAGQSHQQVSA